MDKKEPTEITTEMKPIRRGNKKSKVMIAVIITLFVVAAVLSVVFSYKVVINYNISDYLDKSTQTKIALNIIEDEFGMTGNIQVMAENVDEETAEEICKKIESIPNVLNVNFDKYDSNYYKNNTALFNVIVDGDDYSDNAKQVSADLKRELSEYEVQYGGTAIDKQALQTAITNEIVYILLIAICLVVAILLITSKSWLEPLVLLAASGVAVLLNKGTNVFFGSISYITNSISAILQLALSIDYSIVLLHAYRKCKEERSVDDTNSDVMIRAIKTVVKPVSASSLTTIAGLLALLFMTFTIGFDIGIVLMKGIVISVITSLTLLPALVLLLDKPLEKTHKKAFVPKGQVFCKTAFKGSKAIVPIALALIITCGALQPLSKYTFSDTKNNLSAIAQTFGQNNSVVVVYKNSENNFANEQLLTDTLTSYKKSDGTPVLTSYTAYTNTAREMYDVQKAYQKLDLTEKDAKLLLTMYNLYRNPEQLKLTFEQFIDYADELIKTDSDALEFADVQTTETVKSIKLISNLMANENTAEEFCNKLNEGIEGVSLDLFSVKQIYGLYFYDEVENPNVEFSTMLNFMIAASQDENVSEMFDEQTVAQLTQLSAVIGMIPQDNQLYPVVHGEYGYKQFLPVIKQVATALTGSEPQITVNDDAVQQIYIMYFYHNGTMPNGAINGKTFTTYVDEVYETNSIVNAKLSAEDKKRLDDMLVIDGYLMNTEEYKFADLHAELTALQNAVQSDISASAPEEDKIAGVYIKYSVSHGNDLVIPVMAFELLDFVSDNMDTNALLKQKMSADMRAKVNDAQEDLQKAEELFIGKEYSRLLLSVNLPNESEDTTKFVEYLSATVKDIFGENAYIAGEVVSTYDLQKTFSHDNLLISIFTIAAIFIIVAVIFRSLSLPVILVAVIQGAIWISMTFQLLGSGMFFMSYIVATCILMGATIDYGILMSSNYVANRHTLDKKEALYKSVETAMPTVFSSGLILIVCGFVVCFISSQNAISTVGLLLGVGAICSVVMVTIVLPSVLYLLDKFVLKLSWKKKDIKQK
ncbi:MAG: MMPL family transporter [Candidatus Coproplasma sp.]